MKIDMAHHLGAVTREVGTREHQGQPARVVIAARTYDTTVEDTWDALTSAERIPRWFLPISGDLRLGGRYQLKGNAGGEITACKPPRHLAVTWEYGGSLSWVTVELAGDTSGRTRLQLEHVVPIGDHWEQFGPGAPGVGWDLAIMGLGQHLATGAVVNADEAAAWFASDEGRAFMRESSDDWCRAAIAASVDETSARAAAARTIAAYTGESQAPAND